MSFGIGVGDFLAVIKLTSKIRKDFVEAPHQFKAICDEVRNLSFVLQDVEIDLSGKELNDQQQTEVQKIANSCHKVLSDLENTIAQYKDLGTAKQHATTRSIVKCAWKRLKWEPNDIQELRLRITSNISLLGAFNGRITRDSIRQIVQYQDDEKSKVFLDWISTLDYGAQHSDYIARRQEGTGQWLLDSPEFHSWISGSKQTLFCPGIPGAGKTILTSMVIEELYSRNRNDGSIGMAYIYCNFQRRYGLDSMLATLLKQLVRAQPAVPSILSEMYNEHRPKGTRPSVDELFGAMSALVSQTGGFSQVFLVIDALDECQNSGGSRAKLLDIIFNLQDASNVNLLATSRFIPEITDKFKSMPTLEIRASKDDVTRYVKGNLAILPPVISRRQDLQEEISHMITAAVDGMFLLAQLYLNSLEGKRSAKAIRSALRDLSANKEYESAYDKAMKRIQGQLPDRSQMAMEVLAWITCAERPLTTIELQTALAVEVDESEFDEDNLPDIVDVVSVCAGLVTVDEQSNIIRLVHYTTQEYLERNQSVWFPKAQCDIGRTCIAYLLLDPFKSGHCLTKPEIETRLHNYPLFAYAGRFWGKHVRRSIDDIQFGPSGSPAIQLLSDIGRASACMQMDWDLKALFLDQKDLDIGRTPPDLEDLEGIQEYFSGVLSQESSFRIATGLHLAVYFDLSQAVQILVSLGWPVDSKDAISGTPLCWAAYLGLREIASLLLENGANPNSKDKRGRTPIYLAAIGGFEEIVKLLLDWGVDSTSCCNTDASPLHASATQGSTQVARLLLEQGADPHREGPEGHTPLWYASQHGHEALARLLLDWDSNLDREMELDSSMLRAAEYGHVEVMQLLRDRGSDPSTITKTKTKTRYPQIVRSPTPLILASAWGHESVVKILLEWNVDLDAKDETGRTALMIAISYAQSNIAQILLGRKIDLEAKDKTGRTALLMAVSQGPEHIVRLLLEKGANSDYGDYNGHTAFFHAILRPEETILTCLASYNIKGPHHRNKSGYTPLHFAAIRGRLQSVRALLAVEGFDIDAQDNMGRTALLIAALYNREDIGQVLLENGADPESHDCDGRTAFFYAVSYPYGAMLSSLLCSVERPNRTDRYGRTPLHVAAARGDVQTVCAMLKIEGIDCEIEDKFGRTALSEATSRERHDVVTALENFATGSNRRTLAIEPANGSEKDSAAKDCDVCGGDILIDEFFYHCLICGGGDFDICDLCYQIGARCRDCSHELELYMTYTTGSSAGVSDGTERRGVEWTYF